MKAERFLLIVQKGALTPADEYTRERMRAKGYRVGDVLSATLRKPRNPGFHRLVHAFGQMVAENVEAFEGLSAHAVLKRLQIEANVGCDEVPLNFPGVGPCTYRVPRSLAFSSMDDGEFTEVFAGLCDYVAKTYWSGLTRQEVERMAEVMVNAA